MIPIIVGARLKGLRRNLGGSHTTGEVNTIVGIQRQCLRKILASSVMTGGHRDVCLLAYAAKKLLEVVFFDYLAPLCSV